MKIDHPIGFSPMKNTLIENPHPSCAPAIILNRIWDVRADEKYCVSRHQFAPGTLIAVRTINGEGIIETTSGQFCVRENCITFFKAIDIEKYYTKHDIWDFIWFEFSGAAPEIEYETSVQLSPSLWEKMMLEECMKAICNARTSSLASSIFTSLLLYYLKMNNEQEHSFRNHIVERSVRYIRENIHKNFTISEIARYNNISERYLHLIFRSVLAVSPKEYILSLKLKTAAELIDTTDMHINTIAFSLGFDNQYYFSKVFKRYYGESPSLYRKKNLNR